MMTFEQITQRLGAKRVGANMLARCPAHNDKSPSLSISKGNDGRVLMNCHAGCTFADITQAMGVAQSDLFADEQKGQWSAPRIVAEYNYCDEQGELLFQALRMEPKDFRQRRPENGTWNWSTKGVRRVLYRLDKISRLRPGSRVYVVEGEKDADRLSKLGCEATCNPGGAGRGKWLPAYSEQLRGLSVVVLPDNDKAGYEHARAVAESVPGATICELPGLPEKGDVSDWLNAGGTVAELERLTDPNRIPGFESFADRLDDATDRRERHIKQVIDFGVSYLDDYSVGIHPTDLIIIGAATGAGKTTLGSLLAQGAANNGRRVYFFALEAFKAEIETRLLYQEICKLSQRAGAWKPWMTMAQWMYGRCNELDVYQSKAKENMRSRLTSLHTYYRGANFTKDDITRLFAAVKGKADLIVLDHLHYVDADGPENAEMKKIVQAIRDASLALEIPVIVIAHLRKKQGGKDAREVPSAEDIHGSSEVIKIATKIVMVAPVRNDDFISTKPGIAATYMQVVKDRYRGVSGFGAVMHYDLEKMTYRPNYQVCRIDMGGKVHSLGESDIKPGWAESGCK